MTGEWPGHSSEIQGSAGSVGAAIEALDLTRPSRARPVWGILFGKRFGCGSEVGSSRKKRYRSWAYARNWRIPGLLIRRSSVRVTQGPPVHLEG